MKKLKSLILTMCFMIVVGSSNIYATNRAIHYQTTTSGTSSPPTASGKTELDGKIGEWDPDDSEKPNFDDYDDPNDIEGTIPESDKYFTISMTVPLNMEFSVLPVSSDPFGYFLSPEYGIKNNGSKTIRVKVKEMIQGVPYTLEEEDKTILYIDEEVPGDKKSQMELLLTAFDGNKNKDIPLYDLDSLSEEEKVLFDLKQNETKKVKFDSDRWDLPWFESGKDEAEANFNLKLEFSVVTPSTVTP